MTQSQTRIFLGTCIGNTHLTKQTPNQDSVASWIAPDGIHFCVALSDGHGSSVHPYSEYGSKFAVASALEVYKEVLDASSCNLDPIEFFRKIITRWVDQCMAHFSEHDLNVLTTQSSPLRLYGATLCVVYVLGDSISIASIGDSTVYYRNHSGRFAKFLIHDETPGEATFSLCQSDPLANLEVVHLPYSSGIILISSDGIIKSLKSSSDYALIADYYLGLTSSNSSLDQISHDLDSQLESFSRDGSGDDCTLAMIYIPADNRLSTSSSTRSHDLDPSISCEPLNSSNSRKKKVHVRMTMIFIPLLILLAITALLSVGLQTKIKNQLMNLLRTSLCGIKSTPVQLPNPPLLTNAE
jgi:hypothetical protein